ncbi:hypothetical protein T4A_13032 [Trichinella pseudospiralis]|uniref:Uncharacterized protein n=1 Tax=Trichinella pseudospiralis TaxID=6337 RepID=A0A0V1K1D5_TRIPS|nr:hypothetical protein T4A_13032 [Trichinella pseudospiralis]KRZ41035.1 hypothetical protein T4C_8364 [Trichinella pseudospiralis]
MKICNSSEAVVENWCGSGPIGGGGGGGGGGGHRRVAISLHHLDIVSSDVYFSTLLNAENKN